MNIGQCTNLTLTDCAIKLVKLSLTELLSVNIIVIKKWKNDRKRDRNPFHKHLHFNFHTIRKHHENALRVLKKLIFSLNCLDYKLRFNVIFRSFFLFQKVVSLQTNRTDKFKPEYFFPNFNFVSSKCDNIELVEEQNVQPLEWFHYFKWLLYQRKFKKNLDNFITFFQNIYYKNDVLMSTGKFAQFDFKYDSC